MTKAQRECPYCNDGEYDFGTIDLPGNYKADFAMILVGVAHMECAVYSPDAEWPRIYETDRFSYCPFCGKKLDC